MTDQEHNRLYSESVLESPSVVLIKEEPKLDLKNELTTYFFNSMLKLIVDTWEEYIPETVDSIPSKEKLLTPAESYVRAYEEETVITSFASQDIPTVQDDSDASSSTMMSFSIHKKHKKRNQSETKFKKNQKKKQPVLHSVSSINTNEFQTHSVDEWIIPRTFESVTITFKNGNRYEGPVFGKLMHGQGVFYWADGSKYIGEFKNGYMTGKGVIQYFDGSSYEGQIYKNYRHGTGTMYKADSSSMYKGEWKAGEKDGHGWQLFEPNNWYDGEWKHNYLDGYGLRSYCSGTQYQGNFEKNYRHGTGCALMHNNDIYVGNWVHGVRQGIGEYTWNSFLNTHFTMPVHNKYKGLWRDNNMNGFGILNFGLKGGVRYIGQFKENLKHGPGIVICQNGTIIESNPLFVNDKPVHYKSTGSLDVLSNVTFSEQDEAEETKRSEAQTEFLSTELIIVDDENIPFQESVLSILRQVSIFKYGIMKDTLAYFDVCKSRFPEHKKKSSSIAMPINVPCEQIELNFFICKVICKIREKFGTGDNKICSKHGSNCTDPRKQSVTWASLYSEQKTILNSESDICYLQCNEECKLMRKAIQAQLPQLWKIYNQYTNVACLKVLPFQSWMMRICLWQMYRDFKVPDKGISLVVIDKMMSEQMCFDSESIHDPFEIIYFWQYLHSLIRIAWELYGNELVSSIENNENGILESAFLKFLENDVFPNSGRHTGSVLFDYIDVLPMASVYELYKSFGEPHTALTLLRYCCTLNHNQIPLYYRVSPSTKIPPIQYGINAAPFSDRVTYLPQEPPHLESETPSAENIPASNHNFFLHKLIFLNSLGPKTILNFIRQICPGVGQNKNIININHQLTFLEFYEIILMCTQRIIDIEQKRKVEASRKSTIEEEKQVQESSTITSLEKVLKKKNKFGKSHLRIK